MLVHGPYPIGEPRVAREAAAALAEGFEVEVVATRRSGEPAEVTTEGVRVVRLPLSRRRGAGFASTVLEYVAFTLMASVVATRRHLRSRYDVVHVHNPPDFLIAAALVPKLLGTRVILDVHDLSSHMFGARFSAGRAAPIARGLLRRIQLVASRLADAVVTVHQPYKDELAAQGVDPRKVTIVMNAVDDRLLPNQSNRPQDEHLRIVYHGTLTPIYGLDLLVKAVAKLRDRGLAFTVELYGEGDAAEEIRRSVAGAGLGDRFHITPSYLPQAEVLARVVGASVGVIPNLPSELSEFALSSKLFEYVALKIPVVSADLPTIRAHFSADEIAFFRAGDAGSLADVLAADAADPDGARARAERALRRYEDYRWPVQSARYVTLLRTLLAD